MHLILTGATGLVGSAVLNVIINRADISRISILSRRPVKIVEDADDPRINVILHHGFATYDVAVLAQLEGASKCVLALGTGQNAVSQKKLTTGNKENVTITTTYAVKAAEAFATLASDKGAFQFVFVSGEGATFEPGYFTPRFARVKGKTGLALADVRKANPELYANSVRPGFVDGINHAAIQPYVLLRLAIKQAAITVLGRAYCVAFPSKYSPAQPLGEFLAEMAMGRREGEIAGPAFQKVGEFSIVTNGDFRWLSGLDQ